MRIRNSISGVLAVALAIACGGERPRLVVGEIEFRGSPGSGEPNLHATGDGRVILTWFEPAEEDAYRLRVAVRESGSWSESRTIAEGDQFFVNWADFPSLVELADGRWLVHWPEKVADATYAYHVRLAISRDEGASWDSLGTPHSDASATEHGFVSMVPLDDGGAALIWLDGRQMVEAGSTEAQEQLDPGDMSLRATTIDAAGALGADELLDSRTCECCQTGLVRTDGGLVAAYRDRSDREIRDIAVVRKVEGSWSEPLVVRDDNWMYPGCPVNGPQLSARGDTVVVAWFTAPDEEARVKTAFSFDGGATFGPTMTIDEGDPLGRVDVEWPSGDAAIVSWLERTGAGAEVRLRRVHPSGALGPSRTVAETAGARASGFPRIASVDDALVVAWTEIGEGGGVRVAEVSLER